jgi:hypothetical protein
VTYQGGGSAVTVNQRVNGGQWVLLGTFPFNASGSGYKVDLADTSASGKVVADAVYYVQDGAPVDRITWALDIQSAGDYQLYARWTASSANSGAAQYKGGAWRRDQPGDRQPEAERRAVEPARDLELRARGRTPGDADGRFRRQRGGGGERASASRR